MSGAVLAARVGDLVGGHGSGWMDFVGDVAVGVVAGAVVAAIAVACAPAALAGLALWAAWTAGVAMAIDGADMVEVGLSVALGLTAGIGGEETAREIEASQGAAAARAAEHAEPGAEARAQAREDETPTAGGGDGAEKGGSWSHAEEDEPPATERTAEEPCPTCTGAPEAEVDTIRVNPKDAWEEELSDEWKLLPKSVQAAVRASPRLRDQIAKLVNDGWRIRYDRKSKGAYCNRRGKEIVLGKDYDSPGDLAHEVGHAVYDPPRPILPQSADGVQLSRDEYVNQNINQGLGDEGEALFNEHAVNDEIVSNGGAPIVRTRTLFGQTAAAKAYAAYKADPSAPGARDAAIKAMGESYRYRKGSTDGKTYDRYIGDEFREKFDKTIQPARDRVLPDDPPTSDAGTAGLCPTCGGCSAQSASEFATPASSAAG